MSLPNKEQIQKLRAMMEANRPKPPLLDPPGPYRCKVASVVEKISRNNNKMLAVGLRLMDVPGRPLIFASAVMEGPGWFYGEAFLIACHYNPDVDGEDPESLVGREIWVEVADDPAPDGSLRSRVVKYLAEPPEGYTPESPVISPAPARPVIMSRIGPKPTTATTSPTPDNLNMSPTPSAPQPPVQTDTRAQGKAAAATLINRLKAANQPNQPF